MIKIGVTQWINSFLSTQNVLLFLPLFVWRHSWMPSLIWNKFVIFRRVQLPDCRFNVQTWVLLLPSHHLHSLLHVGHCLLGQFLARSQCCPCSGLSRCHHPTHNVHSNCIYQQFAASSGIHKSYWCVDWGKTSYQLFNNVWLHPHPILRGSFERCYEAAKFSLVLVFSVI